MNVYLLPIGETEPVFFSEGPREAHGDGPPVRPREGSLRHRLESSYHRMSGRLVRSEGGLGSLLTRVWAWLHRQIGADEPLLRALRGAGRIEVRYPCSIAGAEARDVWEGYLARRFNRHLIWLIVNGLLATLSILLMVIPGPNLIGYWFVFRAACHGLALLGLRRARGGRVETTYQPTEALDRLIDGQEDDPRDRTAVDTDLRPLVAFLRRMRAKRVVHAQVPMVGP